MTMRERFNKKHGYSADEFSHIVFQDLDEDVQLFIARTFEYVDHLESLITWIPVGKNLPLYNERVLVMDEKNYPRVGFLSKDDECFYICGILGCRKG